MELSAAQDKLKEREETVVVLEAWATQRSVGLRFFGNDQLTTGGDLGLYFPARWGVETFSWGE